MLNIVNITKKFGDKVAVDSLSLHIEPGDLYGFIGHNGAGKTTTLKACAGIHSVDSGEIFVNGQSLEENPLGCKQIFAYIPDNPDLYEYMTGIKFLNFIADIFKIPADVRSERIHKYAELFEIEESLNTPISEFSHGMKQKLALISA